MVITLVVRHSLSRTLTRYGCSRCRVVVATRSRRLCGLLFASLMAWFLLMLTRAASVSSQLTTQRLSPLRTASVLHVQRAGSLAKIRTSTGRWPMQHQTSVAVVGAMLVYGAIWIISKTCHVGCHGRWVKTLTQRICHFGLHLTRRSTYLRWKLVCATTMRVLLCHSIRI